MKLGRFAVPGAERFRKSPSRMHKCAGAILLALTVLPVVLLTTENVAFAVPPIPIKSAVTVNKGRCKNPSVTISPKEISLSYIPPTVSYQPIVSEVAKTLRRGDPASFAVRLRDNFTRTALDSVKFHNIVRMRPICVSASVTFYVTCDTAISPKPIMIGAMGYRKKSPTRVIIDDGTQHSPEAEISCS